MDRPALTIPEVCDALGVSRRLISDLIAAGEIEITRIDGTTRIFTDTLWRIRIPSESYDTERRRPSV